MEKKLYLIYALVGAFTVILGAFGAHGLKPHLTEYQMAIFEKGIFYQFVHILAGLLSLLFSGVYLKKGFFIPAILFLVGILLFSGSLYLLAVSDILLLPKKIIGPVTPIGGVFFIIAWCSMFFNFYKTTLDIR